MEKEFSMKLPDTEKIKNIINKEVSDLKEDDKELMMIAEKNIQALFDDNYTESLEGKGIILKSIEDFGMETMTKSTIKNTLTSVSMKEFSAAGNSSSQVAEDLMKLEKAIKDIDPSGVDFSRKGFLGRFFNPVKSYLIKYESADKLINSILESLEKGKNTLKNDNVTFEIEEQSLKNITKQLNKEIQIGLYMDESIEKQINNAEVNNISEDKIKFIKNEVLFPIRQRIMDMQSMAVVNQQAILSIEIITSSNKELIRGVNRTKTVTLSAMRTSFMVLQALNNQKNVIDKKKLADDAVNELIKTTSNMLKQQGADIQKMSTNTTLSIETMKQALEISVDVIKDTQKFQSDALPKLKESIGSLTNLLNEGNSIIKQIEKGKNLLKENND